MQSHRHHLRRNHTFGEQHLDGVAQELEELRAGGDASPDELGVVGRERVRHHEVMRAAFPDPERQLVGIGIVVVEKATFLDEKPPRIQTRSVAAVPAEGPGADALADGLDGVPDPAALGVLVELVVLLPAKTVRADVVAAFAYLRAQGFIAAKGLGAGEDGAGHARGFEEIEHPPCRDPGAVLEHALRREVPSPDVRGLRAELGEGALGASGPVRHRRLPALLHVDHEVERKPRAARPSRIGGVLAVPHEVPLAVHVHSETTSSMDWTDSRASTVSTIRRRWRVLNVPAHAWN